MNRFASFARRRHFTSTARRLAWCVVLLTAVWAAPPLPRATAQPLRVGVRAGPTFGFLNDSALPFVSAGGDATANTNVRLDLHAGTYAIVPLGGPFGLQTELLYVRKGGHFSRVGDDDYRAERYQLSYLEGQVLGRRDIALPGPLRLHAVGGLTLSRLLGGHTQRAIHTKDQVVQETIDLTAQHLVRHWDLGALVGLGLDYPIRSGSRVSLDLRYNPGFRSVFTDGARPPSSRTRPFADPPPLTRTPPSLRHDVITASLSYTTSLGR